MVRAAMEIDPADMIILVAPMSAMDAQKEKLKGEGRLSDGNMPIYRPLGGGLVELLAIDHHGGFEVPQLWMFEKIFKDGQDKTWSMALRNTNHLTDPVQFKTEDNGMVAVTSVLGPSDSVLVEDQIWSAPELKGAGDIVVLVDQRGLIVGHTRNPKQLRELKSEVALGANDPNLILKTLLVRRGDHWEAYP